MVPQIDRLLRAGIAVKMTGRIQHFLGLSGFGRVCDVTMDRVKLNYLLKMR